MEKGLPHRFVQGVLRSLRRENNFQTMYADEANRTSDLLITNPIKINNLQQNTTTKVIPTRAKGSSLLDCRQIEPAGIQIPGVPPNPYPAQIINMSLGGHRPGGCSGTLYPEAINQVKAKGALIIVTAGNDDTEAADHVPASCDGVMTVGAVGPYGYRASYSNYSYKYKVDISAPGGDMELGETSGTVLPELSVE